MSALPSARKKARPAAAPPPWLADIGLIRQAGLAFGAALLVALLVIGGSHWWLMHQQAGARAAQQQRDAAFRRYTDIANDGLLIRDYASAYRQLQLRGLIGSNKRLDWIDALKQSQARYQLAPVSYSIEAQRPLQLEGGFTAGTYQLDASQMTLHLDLLHEMDLLNLLQDLRQQAYVGAQSCSVKRGPSAANGETGALAAHFSADCTLNWLTLGLPTGGATPAMPPPGSAP